MSVQNDRIIIDGLREAAAEMPAAIRRGLTTAAIGVHGQTFDKLSGAKGPAGEYPVPVVTGHLRRLLDWLKPGASKSGEAGTFSAGEMSTVVFDSASYAFAIHEGKGSSTKFGARPFLSDGFDQFNEGDKIVSILNDEIAKTMKESLA